MKNLLLLLQRLIFQPAIILLLMVSCDYEAQIKPNETLTHPSASDYIAPSGAVSADNITVQPLSGIPVLTKVQLTVTLAEGSYPGDIIIKFAGCPGNSAPCDGITASVLDIRYLPRRNVKFTVLVPTGAVTGRIMIIDTFEGSIQETSEFKVHNVLTEGLVAFYPFDYSAQDISGNALHGSTYGTMARSADRSGKPNSAYYFDGVDDYISMGDPEKLQLTGQMTIAAWIKYTSGDPTRPIISKQSTTPGLTGYSLNMSWMPAANIHGFNFSSWPAYGTCISSIAGNIAPSTWTFLTVTIEGSTVRSYQNGMLVETWERGCGLTNTLLGNFMVGKTDVYAPHFFQGNIDNVAVYNRVLSAAEVLQVYQYRD